MNIWVSPRNQQQLRLDHVQAPNAERRALRALPLLFGATLGVMLGLILLKAQVTAAWPAWQLGVVPAAVALGIGALVQVLLVPVVRRSIGSGAPAAGKGQGQADQAGLEAGGGVLPAGRVAGHSPHSEVELSGAVRADGDLR